MLLGVTLVFLDWIALSSCYDIFKNFEELLLSVQFMLMICLMVWCASIILLKFAINDLLLICLLLIAAIFYFLGYVQPWRKPDALGLFVGVSLGKGVRFLLKPKANSEKLKDDEGRAFPMRCHEFGVWSFLIGLSLLLGFSSFCRLDIPRNLYHGPRWIGLWNNPNIYGTLMSTGILLTIGLLVESGKVGKQTVKGQKLLTTVFLIVIIMTGVGLLFSYSRGAWGGTVVGLLYLAKVHAKFKWRFVLLGVVCVAAIVYFFWHATPDSAPWYVKRMDLSRPSAQHRIAAWRAGLKIMRNSPFGVGWGNAELTYEENYSPPEGGESAIYTNDYLMLGIQLGVPALLFFLAYVASCFKKIPRNDTTRGLMLTCRAGVLAMLLAFWFDGGLFSLSTVSVFWILLELGCPDFNQREAAVESRIGTGVLRC
jgi:hypothetical protein